MRYAATLLLGLMTLAACPTEPTPVASVTVASPATSVTVGQTVQLTASPKDAHGSTLTGRAVAWATSNAALASVSQTGLVTGLTAGGPVTIIATCEGQTGNVVLTVISVAVATVTVTPDTGTVVVGLTVPLVATAKDTNGGVLTGRVILWSSRNSALASVSVTGVVTGVAAGGPVTITATSEGQNGTATITVVSVPVATVAVTPTPVNLNVGHTVQLTATPMDGNGNVLAGRVVTWATSNAAVATVSTTGLVTGMSAGGPVTITATSEGQSATAAITVTPVPVATVTVTPTPVNVTVGQTVQLTATPRDANGNVLAGRVIVWSPSTSPATVSVSVTGSVTGVAVGGPVTITATSEGKSGIAAITVTPVPVATVNVSPATGSVLMGGTLPLTATTRDAAGGVLTGRAVSWAISPQALASVSHAGVVTGLAVGGPVTITATSEGKSGTARVTVVPVPVASVVVSMVSPDTGPLAGGTSVTILGLNFLNVMAVTIGGSPLASLNIVSGTELTGQTPASASSGAKDVVVTSASSASGSGSCTGCFTYNPVVTVSSVSLNSGPLAGGTSVTITGTSFLNVAAVTIGGSPLANLSVVSGTQLTGQTPTGASSGTKDVVVISSSSGGGTCAGCFTYSPATPNPAVIWTSLVGIGHHTCGLTGDGTAYCWGYNVYGQLGDGSQTDRSTPVVVAGGLAFESLAAGVGWHTCGLTSSGKAYCWGYNGAGQLGDGALTDRTTPVAVVGGLAFASLATSNNHTCGLTRGGAAYCWGNNDFGQLGDGSTTDHVVPVAVTGGHVFASLVVGNIHTCGLTGGGRAYCWGGDIVSQLGDGSSTFSGSSVAVAVAGGLTFTNLAGGIAHTCGLTQGGIAYCWGWNSHGQLGDGSQIDRNTPVVVGGGLAFSGLAAGAGLHSCGLGNGGKAYCWGMNLFGQLGDGSTTLRTTPVAVAGGLAFVNSVAGGNHTCALTSEGKAYCWGYNAYGQLGKL